MLELTPFADLDESLVTQYRDEAAARVEEDNARLDTRGPLGDIVLQLHAILAAQHADQMQRYERFRSLKAINADPASVPADEVDHALSNFRVTRLPGRKATGLVTLVVLGDTPVVIAGGAIFESSSRRFVTDGVYTGKPEGSAIVTDNDRPFRSAGAGKFAFDVPVIAEAEGAGDEIRRGALVIPAVQPPGYVNSYATNDFVSGLDPQSNEEMLEMLEDGIAAKTPSNRSTLRSMLRADEAFARVVRTSSIGCGSPEMHRDRYWIFPISGGGRIDFYVRTSEGLERNLVTKSGIRVGTDTSGNAIIQIAIGRDELPGFYEIAAVRPIAAADDTGSLEITEETRSLDLTGDIYVPDVVGLPDGAYSRYQAAIIKFADTTTDPPAVGAAADYVVELVGLPQIADVQVYLGDESRADLRADILVRAPVPCFVQIHLTVYCPTTVTVDTDAVSTAVAAAINGTSFTGQLYGSALLDAAYAVLPSEARLAGLDMLGELRYPDGRIRRLRSAEVLTIPDAPNDRVTARTVQFFGLTEDVSVSVEALAPAAS